MALSLVFQLSIISDSEAAYVKMPLRQHEAGAKQRAKFIQMREEILKEYTIFTKLKPESDTIRTPSPNELLRE